MPRDRYRRRALLTVLYMPALIVSGPAAITLCQWTGARRPMAFILVAVLAAYAWAIPRTRRLP